MRVLLSAAGGFAQGYATVNASAFFCTMAGCANRSITELIRLMGRQCLAPEAEPVSVAGSIPVALTSVILIEGPGFLVLSARGRTT